MEISITPDQQARIQSQLVARGFASIEDAARHLLDERLAELELMDDDLAWAKPHIDAARAAVAGGDYVTLEEHRAQIAALLGTL